MVGPTSTTRSTLIPPATTPHAHLQGAAKAVHHIRHERRASEYDGRAITAALTSPDTAPALAAALSHVAIQAPRLVTALRDQVLPPIHRATLAERLRHQRLAHKS